MEFISKQTIYSKQTGNVLLVCLALMFIFTLWGISTTRNVTLALESNYNARMKQLSKEAAEFAVGQVGDMLLSDITRVQQIPVEFNGTDGRYSVTFDAPNVVDFAMPANGMFDYSNEKDWDDTRGDMSFIEVDYDDEFEKQPLAIIEYLGRTDADKNTGSGKQLDGRYAFRITAIGWGVDGLASTVIRTHYALNI